MKADFKADGGKQGKATKHGNQEEWTVPTEDKRTQGARPARGGGFEVPAEQRRRRKNTWGDDGRLTEGGRREPPWRPGRRGKGQA